MFFSGETWHTIALLVLALDAVAVIAVWFDDRREVRWKIAWTIATIVFAGIAGPLWLVTRPLVWLANRSQRQRL